MTSRLAINIHFTITDSQALWFHLVFASSILKYSLQIHSLLCHFLLNHHVWVLYFFNPSPICSVFAQTNLRLFDFFSPFSFCYFLPSSSEIKILQLQPERPPDDPQPLMYVQSYPYPLSSNKQEITLSTSQQIELTRRLQEAQKGCACVCNQVSDKPNILVSST